MTRIITTILALIIVLLSSISCSTQKAVASKSEGATLTVNIATINSPKGKMYFSLFNAHETFTNKIPFQSKVSVVNKEQMSVSFTNIPKGTYAVMCFQDTNGNLKMDFDEYFMPTEAYGVSNNPTLYGPPQFEQLAFEVVKENKVIEIILQ